MLLIASFQIRISQEVAGIRPQGRLRVLLQVRLEAQDGRLEFFSQIQRFSRFEFHTLGSLAVRVLNLERSQSSIKFFGPAQRRQAFLQAINGLRGGIAAREFGEHPLEIDHGFFLLLQVGVGHATLLQRLRDQGTVGPVTNKTRELNSSRFILTRLKRELRLLEHGIFGVARVRIDFQQRGQRITGFVAAAHCAQRAPLLVVSIILIGGISRYYLIVEREGLRVAFDHIVGIGQAQGGVIVIRV